MVFLDKSGGALRIWSSVDSSKQDKNALVIIVPTFDAETSPFSATYDVAEKFAELLVKMLNK